MRILSVVGNRPQYIKLAAIHRAIGSNEHLIVNTGQHYDYEMVDIFFKEFSLPATEFALGVGSGTHAAQTAKCMERLEEPILTLDPDIVYVYGDTNTTLAGAIVAKKLGYPVGHIEAGCRSGEPFFIEEINRKCVDHISDILFCPSVHCVENLFLEGIRFGAYYTGDVMVDILKMILPELTPKKDGEYVVATIHRAENTDNRRNLLNIINAFSECGKEVIFVVHPRTQKKISEFTISINSNVELSTPVDYYSLMSLVKGASQVVTDSGGLQKEAFILGVPCITVRPATEWIETLECGWNQLVKPEKLSKYIGNNQPKRPGVTVNYYGNGIAAKKIIERTKVFIEELS